MIARWILAIATRVLRAGTFARTVAPALADLQFERASRSRRQLLRDHIVLWTVLGRAAAHDLRLDLGATFGAAAPAGVWRQIAGLFVLIFIVRGISTISQVSAGIRFRTPDMPPGSFTMLPIPPAGDGLGVYLAAPLIGVAFTAAAYAALPAVFMFCRRHTPARAIVAAALCAAAMTSATARISRPAVERSSLYTEAALRRGTGQAAASQPLAQIVAEDVVPRREAMRRRGVASHDGGLAMRSWFELSYGLNVLVYALIGAALARGRGPGVLMRFAGTMLIASVLGLAVPYLTPLLSPVVSPHWPVSGQILDFLLLPLAACLFLAIPGPHRTAGHGRPA